MGHPLNFNVEITHSAHQISKLLAAQMNSLSSYFDYYTRRRLLLLILTRPRDGALIPNVKKTRKTYIKIRKLGGFTLNVKEQTWLLYSLIEQAETRNNNLRLTDPNNVV